MRLKVIPMDSKLEDLKHIRSMMERSSKFLSLSGMSGVSAGLFALLGAFVACQMLNGRLRFTDDLVIDFVVLAALVLVCALVSGLFFCYKKSKKNKVNIWMPVTKHIVIDFSIPMLVGGLFCLILIVQNLSFMVASTMLVFYGLALISAGSRTYGDIKVLGLCEISLGLLAGIIADKGLLFWAVGFGVLHIIYGIVLYLKYDCKARKSDVA